MMKSQRQQACVLCKVSYVNINVKPLLKIETFRGNIQSGCVAAG